MVQRQKTSTPLQSLILLNDPQFTEASRALAANAMKKYENDADQIRYCYRALTGRKPSPKETAILERLYTDELEKFKAEPSAMKGWLTSGASVTATKTPQLLAACTVMASTIMNSDAFVTRR
mgnify:FL=1